MFLWIYLPENRVISNLQMVEDPVKEISENSIQAAAPNPTSEEVTPVCAVFRAMVSKKYRSR